MKQAAIKQLTSLECWWHNWSIPLCYYGCHGDHVYNNNKHHKYMYNIQLYFRKNKRFLSLKIWSYTLTL